MVVCNLSFKQGLSLNYIIRKDLKAVKFYVKADSFASLQMFFTVMNFIFLQE